MWALQQGKCNLQDLRDDQSSVGQVLGWVGGWGGGGGVTYENMFGLVGF